MENKTENDWQELSERILTDIKEWRKTHPKATFREIEEEVHQQMSRWEAQVLQDAAQASESRVEKRDKNDRSVQFARRHFGCEESRKGICKASRDKKSL